ncbi:UDP-N-acetylmuramate--L-alanine ligase [Synechococcus sp. Tobar12-5m-g]|uniref:UDP-N-acetylmuramate--L-alanine ligase n=1 Tax=unclassified Synechococcus TaxID=2626047 RepID=UPI0020CE4DD4|nr:MULTISPECIES: UDP-N-acetylmuramate--L-alanine ligase [unclassified Synechococcus]MCP9772380.1 UDP-N-acetylmuramate--L-alanine ligase [Synechococcus sp. Tobar12-5m-g]MCP9873967.1 UDP-N-acetylmuramate--L-alanine ligase [Synechococcus sp. Cruz CV-v-12]
MGLLLDRLQPLHFIGVGGIGMSALAVILADRGFQVSGSDSRDSSVVQDLRNRGVKVYGVQGATTIEALCTDQSPLPQVVISSAVPNGNLELEAARRAGLPVFHRSDVLAALINGQPSIAVAGSHGKTTTSTLIATLLAATGNDPTAVIGGVVPAFRSNARAGQGRLLVAEADESDGSLVKFRPTLGLITNLELDHTDHYPNLEALIHTLGTFAAGCETVLANGDCPVLREHFQPAAWWSIEAAEGVGFAALPLDMQGDGTLADFYEDGVCVGSFCLPVPGRHNLSNATAALAACRLQGIPFAVLTAAIQSLKAPGRRFDFRGSIDGRLIVDDYAHHPSEVDATLRMGRLMVETGRSPLPTAPKRVMAVFQPHRYSRTAEFLHPFATALAQADMVLLAPLYAAGETPIPGISSERLASEIRQVRPELTVHVAANLDQLAGQVCRHCQAGDLVLVMGAGDVNGLWERLQSRPELDAPASLVA